MKKSKNNERPKFFLLSWIIIPVLAVWLTTNYIVGSLRRPSWENGIFAKFADNSAILSVNDLNAKAEREKLNWDGNGLVTIWFDDAWLSQLNKAYPILEGFGYKGALAVTTGYIGYPSYMNWDHVKLLENKGWEIASHSKLHNCDIGSLSKEQIEDEFVASKKELVNRGLTVSVFVAPCGEINEVADDFIKNNYTGSRTVISGLEEIPPENKYRIKGSMVENYTTLDDVKEWLNNAKRDRMWLNIVFHQIDDSQSEYSVSPEFFIQIVNAINDSQLKVVLPSQVLEIEK